MNVEPTAKARSACVHLDPGLGAGMEKTTDENEKRIQVLVPFFHTILYGT